MALQLMGGLTPDNIGGAKVNKAGVTINGVKRKIGDMLTEAEVKSIRLSNLSALVTQRSITPWPKIATEGETVVLRPASGNKFDVVVGRVINPTPLSKADATALAEKTAADLEAASQVEPEAEAAA